MDLKPEQEQMLAEAVRSGLAQTKDDALTQALKLFLERVSKDRSPDAASAARRLGAFGRRHGLSLDGINIKDLLRESRP
jgi:hypothetical protein